jgi:uncharacterized phage protein gp47/JayE
MSTLEDLTTPETPDQEKAGLLASLQAKLFPVTDWIPGSAGRTIVEAVSKALSDLTSLVSTIAAGGFLGYASGDWLTLLASDIYGLTRNPSAFTKGKVVLTAAATAGPFTIVAGQLFFKSTSGQIYVNTTGGTLSMGGTLTLSVQAQNPGSQGNAPANTVTVLATPLPGVTVNNPVQIGAVAHGGAGSGTTTPTGTPSVNSSVIAKITKSGGTGVGTFQYSTDGGVSFSADQTIVASFTGLVAATGLTLAFAGTFTNGDTYSFNTSWITSSGADQETDDALRSRCQARWPSLGVAPTSNVYDLWARTAAPIVTRTVVRTDPTVAGQVDVVLATPDGPTDGTTVSAVAAYIAQREPVPAISSVQSAAALSVAVTATIYVTSGQQDAATAQATANLQGYFSSIPIGGTVYLAEIIRYLADAQGVVNVVVTAPVTDTVLSANQVAQLALTLATVPV